MAMKSPGSGSLLASFRFRLPFHCRLRMRQRVRAILRPEIDLTDISGDSNPRCVVAGTNNQMSAISEPLTGQRVVLRELRSTDWEGIHSYASLPEACRYQSWGPNSQEQSRAFCYQQITAAEEEPRHLYALAITTPGHDSIIGTASLHVSSFEHGKGDISFIVHPREWGRGYATEAALLLLGFEFSELLLHRIHATCDPLNVASARVLEKIGMTLEGRLRESMRIRDGWRDSLVYSVLAKEWNFKERAPTQNRHEAASEWAQQ
jgi:ribosomal-protein-alanine N-acetyltransferase